MTKLEVAALYVGFNLLLLVFLGLRVANFRRANQVGLGDAGNPALLRLIRIHGNAAEWIPAGAVGLMFLALLEPVPILTVHVAGASLTAGRLLHLMGLTQAEGASFGRVAGMVLTFAALITCGAGSIWAALSPVL